MSSMSDAKPLGAGQHASCRAAGASMRQRPGCRQGGRVRTSLVRTSRVRTSLPGDRGHSSCPRRCPRREPRCLQVPPRALRSCITRLERGARKRASCGHLEHFECSHSGAFRVQKERKQTTQGRDGRTARRHHTGILRRGVWCASRRPPLGVRLFLSHFAVSLRFS